MCENFWVSALTGKRVKGDNDSAIKEHNLFCNHSSGFDNFSILASNNKDFKVALWRVFNQQDHPPLNKNRHLLPLEVNRSTRSHTFEWYHFYFRRPLAVTWYFQEYFVCFKQALAIILFWNILIYFAIPVAAIRWNNGPFYIVKEQ